MGDNLKAELDRSRRGFLKSAAIAGVSAVIPTDKIPAGIETAVETKDEAALGNFQAPKRPLGKTGLECSILGMGGFHLATVADQTEINNMVAKAIDHGINIFDNAWESLDGLSEERLGVALRGDLLQRSRTDLRPRWSSRSPYQGETAGCVSSASKHPAIHLEMLNRSTVAMLSILPRCLSIHWTRIS